MRIILFIFVVLIVTACSEDSNKDSGPTTDGLVAYYKFNGNSDDNAGSNDGVDTNVAFSDNDDREAVEFSGDYSYVSLPDDFDYENRTISFSFSAREFEDPSTMMYSSDNNNTVFGLTVISVQDASGITRLNINISNQLFSVPITANTWYNVIAIAEGKSYRYYVNGALVSSGTFAEYIHSGNGVEFAVVGRARESFGFFNGFVDNLRIYNRALTEEEVEILAEH